MLTPDKKKQKKAQLLHRNENVKHADKLDQGKTVRLLCISIKPERIFPRVN